MTQELLSHGAGHALKSSRVFRSKSVGRSSKSNKAWKKIETEITRFLAVNAHLVSAPMWNFNIPSAR